MHNVEDLAPKDYFEKDRSVDTGGSVADSLQQLKAKIRAVSDIIEVAETGFVTVDYLALKRKLRELSAI